VGRLHHRFKTPWQRFHSIIVGSHVDTTSDRYWKNQTSPTALDAYRPARDPASRLRSKGGELAEYFDANRSSGLEGPAGLFLNPGALENGPTAPANSGPVTVVVVRSAASLLFAIRNLRSGRGDLTSESAWACFFWSRFSQP